jgi:phytoene dehydrogenase-like protein
MDRNLLLKGMDKTLPGLENFYICGQWVEPGGGLPTSAGSGRNVIGMICKRDGKKFTAGLPAAS